MPKSSKRARKALDKRRRTYVRLIGEIHHALNQALVEENALRQLTITKMAEILGHDKSFVSKKMSGMSNMTLETLADLAFALNRPVRVALPSRAAKLGSNHVDPRPETSSAEKSADNNATTLAI